MGFVTNWIKLACMHADLHWKSFIASWNLSVWLFPVDGPAESHRNRTAATAAYASVDFFHHFTKVELIIKVLKRPCCEAALCLRFLLRHTADCVPDPSVKSWTHIKKSHDPRVCIHFTRDRVSMVQRGERDDRHKTHTENGGKRSTVIQKMSQILALIDVKTTLAVTHRPPHAAAAAHAHAPQSRDALRHRKTFFTAFLQRQTRSGIFSPSSIFREPLSHLGCPCRCCLAVEEEEKNNKLRKFFSVARRVDQCNERRKEGEEEGIKRGESAFGVSQGIKKREWEEWRYHANGNGVRIYAPRTLIRGTPDWRLPYPWTGNGSGCRRGHSPRWRRWWRAWAPVACRK